MNFALACHVAAFLGGLVVYLILLFSDPAFRCHFCKYKKWYNTERK